jgi:hypothetical protein
MSEGAFWNDQEYARDIVQQVKVLKGWIEPIDSLGARIKSAREIDELLSLEPDAAMSAELDLETERIIEEIDAFELKSLLRGRDDFRDAQIEISAGAGGTEAQDWAQMIMRLYTRWAERKGFEIEMLDLSEGEEAGIKGAVMEIKGQYAYGFLRPESGVHRLVRISPFDSQARRHTSFASVFVYPVVDDEINIEIREEAGAENFFMFGLTAAEVARQKREGYDPMHYYHANPDLRAAIDLIRNGQRMTVQTVVGKRPTEEELANQSFDPDAKQDDDTFAAKPQQGPSVVQTSLGLVTIPLTPQIARQLGAGEDAKGVVITAVDGSSDAAAKGLQRGDIVLSANYVAVTTIADLEKIVRTAKTEGREAVLLRIQRRGQPATYMPVRLR